VEVAQQRGRPDAAADHVHTQRPPAGLHGRDRALLGDEQLPRAGEERLSVDREPGAARRAQEQPHAEVALQRSDALGDRLLRER